MIELTKEKISLQKKYIKDITELNEEQAETKQSEIDEARTEIELLNERIKDANEYVIEHQDQKVKLYFENNQLYHFHNKKVIVLDLFQEKSLYLSIFFF